MGGRPTELLIVVPARGGSKRLPRKNIRVLAGRSLLAWTQESISEAALDAPCLLSTDDEEIAAAGRELGWMVPFQRPAALAHDNAPTVPAVLHALDWFAEHHNGDPRVVMVLQVTSPFRGGACLRRGVELLETRSDCEAVVAVRQLPLPSDKLFRRNEDDVLVPVDAGYRGTTLYAPNGALYVIRTAVLRKLTTLLPPRTLALVMGDIASLDVDTDLDWSLAELVAARQVHDTSASASAVSRKVRT